MPSVVIMNPRPGLNDVTGIAYDAALRKIKSAHCITYRRSDASMTLDAMVLRSIMTSTTTAMIARMQILLKILLIKLSLSPLKNTAIACAGISLPTLILQNTKKLPIIATSAAISISFLLASPINDS